MFENFASIMNKASVQNEKSNILNGLKLPIIAVFLLGVVLISFALITTNTIFSYILLGCGLAVMVIGLPILICVYLHFYTRSYNVSSKFDGLIYCSVIIIINALGFMEYM